MFPPHAMYQSKTWPAIHFQLSIGSVVLVVQHLHKYVQVYDPFFLVISSQYLFVSRYFSLSIEAHKVCLSLCILQASLARNVWFVSLSLLIPSPCHLACKVCSMLLYEVSSSLAHLPKGNLWSLFQFFNCG